MKSTRVNANLGRVSVAVIAGAAVIAILIYVVIRVFYSGSEDAQSKQSGKYSKEEVQHPSLSEKNQFFSPDILQAKLGDYSKILNTKDIISSEQLRERVKKIFDQRDGEQIDLAMADFIYDSGISRGEKIAALIDFIKANLSEEKNVMYSLDILSALKPLEFSADIIEVFEKSGSIAVKARVISTLGQAMTFTPAGAVSASDANTLNMNISRIQGLMQRSVFSSDAAIQTVALSEYVKIAPQSEATHTIQILMNSGGLSEQLKYGVVIDAAISEKTAAQSVIINEIIKDAAKDKSSPLLQSKIVGMLQASDSGDIFTQESKYILQDYLKSREPIAIDPKNSDILINAAEFNEWLNAYSSASSTPSTSAAQWAVNYIKMSGDSLKVAYAITLSKDDVINIIASDSALVSQLKSKMQLSLDSSALDQEKQLFSSAIARLPPKK